MCGGNCRPWSVVRRKSWWGFGTGDPSRAIEVDAPCAPAVVPLAVRSAESHGARHTSLHRWSRSIAVFPYRQDTRVGASRQSVSANTPQPDASAHTAIAREPGVSGGVEGAGIWHPLGSAPCRPDTVNRRSCCGYIPGSGCWVRRPTFGPSSAANGPDQSQAHDLTFVGTQVLVASCCHGNTRANRGLQCCILS